MADVAVLKGTRQPGFIMAQDLSLRDVRMKAYEHVSLNLDRGMAHAICAEDKGGKTELLLTLAGRMHPTSGSCVVPTARESILKPRRKNRPDTRERTPGSLSTSTPTV